MTDAFLDPKPRDKPESVLTLEAPTSFTSLYGKALSYKRNGSAWHSEVWQRQSSSWQTSHNRQGQHQGQYLQLINHVNSAHTSVWERVCITNLTSSPAGFFSFAEQK